MVPSSQIETIGDPHESSVHRRILNHWVHRRQKDAATSDEVALIDERKIHHTPGLEQAMTINKRRNVARGVNVRNDEPSHARL